MDNVVKYFNSIEASFKKTKIITIAAVIMAGVVSLGAVFISATYVASHSDNIYVLDRGTAYSATVAAAESINRSYEVEDHVTRFHEFMFNLPPSSEAIRTNVEAATLMCDQSAYDYYMDLQEKGYYSRLISNNMTQYLSIDSVKVNMGVYPYTETTYGRLFILRESNVTQYRFESIGQVVDVGRSKKNPHGLMLEKFTVTHNDNMGTRRRN